MINAVVEPTIAMVRQRRGLLWLMRRAWRRPVMAAGLAFLAAVILVAVLAPQLAPHDPRQQRLAHRLQGPTLAHLLGTDQFGRDILSRLIWGARVSLAVAVVAVGLAMVLGVGLGVYAGYGGGGIDNALMRATDLMMSFPALMLGLMVVSVLGSGLGNVILAVALTLLPRFIRFARGLTLSVREREFVDAARAIGASSTRIMVGHIMPQLRGQIVVIATLWMATAVRLEASLSFLGLGISPPIPTWGNMIRDAVSYLSIHPSFAVSACLALGLTVLAFNLVGDAYQDILDPRLRSAAESVPVPTAEERR